LCEFGRETGYPCRGNKYDWHHPIDEEDFGVWLCESHHALLKDRRRKYPEELLINKTLEEMREEIRNWLKRRIQEAGLNPEDIDKY